jgi:hypothetical protein
VSYFLVVTAAVIAVALLTLWYARLRAGDRISAIIVRNGTTSMLSSRAQLIDGANHIPVALSLDDAHVTYENSDLHASIDVQQIDEVEYGSDLITGGIADGAILRLRSHGRAFEFVLDVGVADQWSHQLPPHRMNELGHVHVLAAG